MAPGPSPITKSACIAELRRVAALLGQQWVTWAAFNRHSTMRARTVSAIFGGWSRALHEAGLTWRHNVWRETPLETLARALVQATVDLGRVPTYTELERHAGLSKGPLAKRWGGYAGFKRAALAHLLAPETRLAVGPDVRALLEAEEARLNRGTADARRPPAGPPRNRRRLGLRGFAYAPTNEQGVVALFAALAQDLGFEILHLQSAYPDGLVRRHGKPQRVEFEYTSRDFLRHGHAPAGADLIICWEHDWPESPLPVLSLREAIKERQEPPRTRRARRTATKGR